MDSEGRGRFVICGVPWAVSGSFGTRRGGMRVGVKLRHGDR